MYARKNQEEAHPAVVNSVAWQGPEGSHLLASTSADAALLLHDIREFHGLFPYMIRSLETVHD